MHLGQDFLGESFGDLVDIGSATSLFNTLLLGLSKLLDMAVEGILFDVMISYWSCCRLGCPNHSVCGRKTTTYVDNGDLGHDCGFRNKELKRE